MKPIFALLLLCSPALAENQFVFGSNSATLGVITNCQIASVGMNDNTNAVTVDWDCVDKFDKEFLAGKGEFLDVFAHVMKAIHDGTAQNSPK